MNKKEQQLKRAHLFAHPQSNTSNTTTTKNQEVLSQLYKSTNLEEKFKVLINVFATEQCKVFLKLCYPAFMKNVKLGPVLIADIRKFTASSIDSV